MSLWVDVAELTEEDWDAAILKALTLGYSPVLLGEDDDGEYEVTIVDGLEIYRLERIGS